VKVSLVGLCDFIDVYLYNSVIDTMSGNNRSYILFDDYRRDQLLPFTFIRPVAEIRFGILTIREKWEKWTGQVFSYKTQDYLQEKFPLRSGDENMLINGSVVPNQMLIEEILALNCGELLMKDSLFIAGCLDRLSLDNFDGLPPEGCKQKQIKSDFLNISKPWHIFLMNGNELRTDFKLITANRQTIPVSSTNNLINPANIFVEEGAKLEYVTINASVGPVYIGKNTIIMEGALIRGPFALCEGSQVKMGARIYGDTTVGPYSKVGGEITNSVIFGSSNKVHDGYMGNSVIGEWCNIGAGSNTSNLKNNYTQVKIWNYAAGRAEETGLQFCGLFMGDYSRCGINTMFNTGTVVGISANLYGSSFPGSFIPSFSWGGAAGFETYRMAQALETIETGMTLRQLNFGEADKKIIDRVFTLTGRYRKSV
jgi:UDP-N-acetylglucosamine diphosphorylase/glucosamine-1-phosphate N-acetyltransferase